jgi:RND superfamily putative drug exporter
VDALYTRLGRAVVRFRYLIVLVWIALTIGCVAAFPSLDSVIKSATISDYLPSSAPSAAASSLAASFHSSQSVNSTLVAVRNDGPLTAADQAAFDQVANLVRAAPHVTAVRDLSISQDGQVRQADVETNLGLNPGAAGTTLVDNIRQTFGQVHAPAGLSFHLTGSLATAVDNSASNKSSQNAAQRLTYLLIIVLLLVAFRAVLAPLLTLAPAALVLVLSDPAIAGAVTRLSVSASSITQIVLIVLVLGAGTDYGLFLTFRVREELRRGLDPHAAVVRAVETVGETITFSALTVIAALLTLATAQFGVYTSLGPSLAIGIGLMLLAGLTLLPALLAIFGRAAFWPTSTVQQEAVLTGPWGRLTSRLIARPAVTLTAGIVLFGALAAGYIGTNLSGFSNASSGPSGTDSAAGTAAIDAHFPAATQNPTSVVMRFSQPVWSHLSSLSTAQQGLMGIAAIRAIVGPLNPNGLQLTPAQLAQLHAALGPAQALPAVPPANSPVPAKIYNAYRATGQYISTDGLTVQFVAELKDTSSSSQAVSAIPALRSSVASVATAAGAAQSGLYSRNAFAYDVEQVSQSDLNRIIPIVAVMIAILLGLVLRSVIAPLYLVASVVISYFAALGLTSLVFVRLGVDDGIEFILPFILFVFLMALGSDYNILVMRRIREEAQRQPLRQAVQTAIARTGSTVTSAGLILAGTFAVLAATSNTDQTRQLGFGVAAGILMDTFLIRTLLIPALVTLLGRWNWWPSPLSRSSRTSETPEAPTEPALPAATR